MRNRLLIFILVLLLVTSQASAAIVTLSNFVSGGATPPDVTDLYATIEFVVVDSELFVTVDNRTDERPNQYSISEIFWNAPDTLHDIPSSGKGQEFGDGLVLTGLDVGGLGVWQKSTEFAFDGHQINGFGEFDMRIQDGGQQVIAPGETATFTFAPNGIDI